VSMIYINNNTTHPHLSLSFKLIFLITNYALHLLFL
jgi:hypothetical protein